MKRLDFLKALGFGAAAAVVAPTILLGEIKDPVMSNAAIKARRGGFSTANSGFSMIDIEGSLNKDLIKTFGDQDLSGFLRKIS